MTVSDHLVFARPGSFSYRKTSDNLHFSSKVHNIVPGDFNYDGKLDLLVMLEHDDGGWWSESTALDLRVYIQDGEGHFGQCRLAVPK